MIKKIARVAWLVPVALTLGACGGVDLAAYEREEFSACYVDQGDWAGERRAARYVEASFGDFERHFGRFLDELERAATRAASEPPTDRAKHFASLHNEAQANIVRLGRLVPRMNRPLDLAPMVGQFEEAAIWWPRGDHHTEFLRVALAEEFAGHQNLAEHMVLFLSRFERVEALLLSLKYAGKEESAATPPSLNEVARAARQLREGWEAAEPGMRRVIFDRPDMPSGESLSERLHARVAAICRSYSDCGDGADCGADISGDDSPSEDRAG